FDINTACTSFLYGLSAATALIRTRVVRNALVIGAELISPFMDWSDRDVAVLFGDGAAAVVLEASEREEGLVAEKLGCYGEARTGADGAGVRQHPALRQYVGGHRAGGALRGARGAPCAPGGAAPDARVRRRLEFLRAPGALGQPYDAPEPERGRAAAEHPPGARDPARVPRAQAPAVGGPGGNALRLDHQG